jgi:chloramphenicol-sensitive protein RarD
VNETRRGVVYGATAYLLWGVFPLFFPLLEPSRPVEVLAHRITWSLLVMAVVVVAVRKQASVRRVVADRRRLVQLTAAACALCLNWGVYIYGVTSDHVVETSLGYFINPLVTVLLGVFVLREQLRPVQWGALGIAALAVLVLSVENGRPPWIALVLAFSFGTYGLLKKTARVGAVEGLAIETAVLAPLAIAYLAVVAARGESTFISEGAGHATLLVLTGIVTAVPLLFFGGAASRVPLTTLGPLQYLAPIVQFLIGVLVFHEHVGPLKAVGFVLVWTALVIFTVDLVGHARRSRFRVPVAEPV